MPRKPTRYYPEYGAQLPTSGPDWRWAKALEIVSKRKNVSLHRDGPDIARAIRFIRHTCKIVTGQPMRRIFKEDPDLILAYRLATDGGRRELELQCRILARESAGVIAVEMGLTKSIVGTYCTMFFDVTERLGATSYILYRAIGMPLVGPPAPEALMMACCFRHGPGMIDPWLDYLDHQCEVHDLGTKEGRMRESLDLLLAAHSLAFDAETNFSLLKRLRAISETRTKMFSRPSVAQVFSENVLRQLGETIWRTAENGGRTEERKPNGRVSGSSRTARLQIAQTG